MTEPDPADTVPVPRDTNDVCGCGHFMGWHRAEGGGVFGICLWPNGWPDKRECKCNAFAAADSPPVNEDDEPVNQNCRVCLGYTHPLDEHATGCPAAPSPSTREPVPTDESALDERLSNLLAVCDAYQRGDELTPQQIDRFHNLADMTTVRWLIRTVWGMTAHRDALTARLSASTDRAERAEAERDGTLAAYREQRDHLNRVMAERDALTAKLEAVKRLADEWATGTLHPGVHPLQRRSVDECVRQLHAAVQSVQETGKERGPRMDGHRFAELDVDWKGWDEPDVLAVIEELLEEISRQNGWPRSVQETDQ